MNESERVYKVAVFGVIGTGKSSIINLLADKQVADVSTGVEPCTRRARWYPISLGMKKFRLWDTMGFNPADGKGINPLSPYEQAHALLQNLPDGVDLILLCGRTDRIGTSLRKLYWLLDGFFFKGCRVKIALVLTHFDTIPEQDQPNWWSKNKEEIAQRSGIPLESLSHAACITTVYDGSPESDPLYQHSKEALRKLLETVNTSTPTPFPSDLLSSDSAAKDLNSHCQLSIHDATRLVEKFRSPQRPFNAILFGESGSGKSSVINLLLGDNKAEVSINMNSCTLDFQDYDVNAGLHRFQIWDTVGLNGMSGGQDMWLKAMENAVQLIRSLHDKGGVDLLVFCKKAGRFSPSERDSFRLFYEFICEGQVPVALIITHLEFMDPMEKWWETNGKELLETCELKPSAITGHACITSLGQDDARDKNLSDKLSLSRQLVQTMLEDSISYGNTFDKDEGAWVMAFLKKFFEMVKGRIPLKSSAITVRNLVKRCRLSKEQAEQLVNLLAGIGP